MSPLHQFAFLSRLNVPLLPAAGRHGRPPVHPNTVDRHVKQRRLSFSQTAAGGAAVPSATKAAGAAASQASPSSSALAAAAGRGLTGGRTSAACTPLEKLDSELTGRQQQQQHQLLDEPRGVEVHPKQAALAASLCEEDLQFNGSLLSEQDACLLASMPEQLRRMSTDGIISLDTLRVGASAANCSWVAALLRGWLPCCLPGGLGGWSCSSGRVCHAVAGTLPAFWDKLTCCLLRFRCTDGSCSSPSRAHPVQMLDIAEQQHKRLSGPEAQERRVSNAALGQLPRTFTRVQRIFGVQVS